ncbi:hypothetical protein [Janthinobacterium psychrotolerans]|uniref:Uncharacterized protein n=1 Tax=Janthinobacterium psychrotolerans TaxID=1747903 RepID=A0A1A7BXN8_9BURK|nr:hypothetical protein [Janthinobacterium psychrotolerans]OBV38287.1 hypothetical protein ASR47_1005241 [Janthinobacterium psychrotolerans]
MDHLYNHAAIGYANLWWKQDRLLLQRMKETGGMSAVLPDIAVAYSVIRSIPGGRNSKQWQQIAYELDNQKKLTTTTYVQIVEQWKEKLGSKQNLLSAASKLLWFHSKNPVKILDSRAAKALKFKNGTYNDYCALWKAEYKLSELQIQSAILKLIEQVDCTVIPPEGRAEFFEVVNQKWFAERIFDKYLWNQGGK